MPGQNSSRRDKCQVGNRYPLGEVKLDKGALNRSFSLIYTGIIEPSVSLRNVKTKIVTQASLNIRFC